jgi:hypothetical protein
MRVPAEAAKAAMCKCTQKSVAQRTERESACVDPEPEKIDVGDNFRDCF